MTQCQKPFFVKDGDGKQVLVPCGKCPKCKARRVSGWSFRLLQEDKKSISSKFITLTYDDTHKPITRKGNSTLCKRDLQLFFKRLRRSHKGEDFPKRNIKYFAAGEYGGKIGRPHYHIILFNADYKKIAAAWSARHVINKTVKLKRKNRYGQSHKKVRSIEWRQMGHINYGDKRGVTGASVGYCLKYILTPKWKSDGDDRQPEFIHMSKGLGKGYVNDRMIKWHKADINNRMYINVGDGKKAAMPRYYKDKIYSDDERKKVGEYQRDKLTEEILQQFYDLFNSDPDYVGTYQSHNREKEESIKAAYRKQHSKSKSKILVPC